jgi:hypothetical protein
MFHRLGTVAVSLISLLLTACFFGRPRFTLHIEVTMNHVIVAWSAYVMALHTAACAHDGMTEIEMQSGSRVARILLDSLL